MLKGKVVLIPFPFDDLSSLKVRPAVCLTDGIGPFQHVIVAFITSQIPDLLLDSDILLPRSDGDDDQMGLKVDSTLRLHRLITVTTSLIRRELGQVPPHVQ